MSYITGELLWKFTSHLWLCIVLNSILVEIVMIKFCLQQHKETLTLIFRLTDTHNSINENDAISEGHNFEQKIICNKYFNCSFHICLDDCSWDINKKKTLWTQRYLKLKKHFYISIYIHNISKSQICGPVHDSDPHGICTHRKLSGFPQN